MNSLAHTPRPTGWARGRREAGGKLLRIQHEMWKFVECGTQGVHHRAGEVVGRIREGTRHMPSRAELAAAEAGSYRHAGSRAPGSESRSYCHNCVVGSDRIRGHPCPICHASPARATSVAVAQPVVLRASDLANGADPAHRIPVPAGASGAQLPLDQRHCESGVADAVQINDICLSSTTRTLPGPRWRPAALVPIGWARP